MQTRFPNADLFNFVKNKTYLNEQQQQIIQHAQLLLLNTRILAISLYYSGIGDEGAKYLAEAIKFNSSLQRIDLEDNNLGFEGATIKLSLSLQQINLGKNNIGDEGAQSLVEALDLNSSLQEIRLYSNEIHYDLKYEIDEMLKENILRKNTICRKFACAFTENQVK
jgi:Ran GTPase-activating protein (RanGAP) involved in mRNA processing and transport